MKKKNMTALLEPVQYRAVNVLVIPPPPPNHLLQTCTVLWKSTVSYLRQWTEETNFQQPVNTQQSDLTVLSMGSGPV